MAVSWGELRSQCAHVIRHVGVEDVEAGAQALGAALMALEHMRKLPEFEAACHYVIRTIDTQTQVDVAPFVRSIKMGLGAMPVNWFLTRAIENAILNAR